MYIHVYTCIYMIIEMWYVLAQTVHVTGHHNLHADKHRERERCITINIYIYIYTYVTVTINTVTITSITMINVPVSSGASFHLAVQTGIPPTSHDSRTRYV